MTDQPLIETRNLRKAYEQGDTTIHALDDVTLAIEEGEFVAVVGPSGSGKTTLLNMVGALDCPTSGSVWLHGQAINTMRERQIADFRRDHIGFVFQSYNLIPVLTAAENIEYVMVLQGIPQKERQERVAAILAEVGLAGMEHRRPYQLSGGQQQRVAIARAVVANPSIILADEPTANVDSHIGADLLDLMHELNEELKMTFLFSTHDPMVMEHAKRVIRLQDGKVVEDETKGER